MVPIHDSDVAEERWSRAEWENYELWEKVGVRLKRQKQLWILATVIVFMILSSVPVIMEYWPKWMCRSTSRHLAQLMNRLKHQAIVAQSAHRIRFDADGSLNYLVEVLPNCKAPQGFPIRRGILDFTPPFETNNEAYLLLSSEQGEAFNIPGLKREYCYDPLQGSGPASAGEVASGFGVIPAKDLEDKRTDRLSILLVTGQEGDLSFD